MSESSVNIVQVSANTKVTGHVTSKRCLLGTKTCGFEIEYVEGNTTIPPEMYVHIPNRYSGKTVTEKYRMRSIIEAIQELNRRTATYSCNYTFDKAKADFDTNDYDTYDQFEHNDTEDGLPAASGEYTEQTELDMYIYIYLHYDECDAISYPGTYRLSDVLNHDCIKDDAFMQWIHEYVPNELDGIDVDTELIVETIADVTIEDINLTEHRVDFYISSPEYDKFFNKFAIYDTNDKRIYADIPFTELYAVEDTDLVYRTTYAYICAAYDGQYRGLYQIDVENDCAYRFIDDTGITSYHVAVFDHKTQKNTYVVIVAWTSREFPNTIRYILTTYGRGVNVNLYNQPDGGYTISNISITDDMSETHFKFMTHISHNAVVMLLYPVNTSTDSLYALLTDKISNDNVYTETYITDLSSIETRKVNILTAGGESFTFDTRDIVPYLDELHNPNNDTTNLRGSIPGSGVLHGIRTASEKSNTKDNFEIRLYKDEAMVRLIGAIRGNGKDIYYIYSYSSNSYNETGIKVKKTKDDSISNISDSQVKNTGSCKFVGDMDVSRFVLIPGEIKSGYHIFNGNLYAYTCTEVTSGYTIMFKKVTVTDNSSNAVVNDMRNICTAWSLHMYDNFYCHVSSKDIIVSELTVSGGNSNAILTKINSNIRGDIVKAISNGRILVTKTGLYDISSLFNQ